MQKGQTWQKSVVLTLGFFLLLLMAGPGMAYDPCPESPGTGSGTDLETDLEITVDLEENPAPGLLSRISGQANAEASSARVLDVILDAKGFVVQTGENEEFNDGQTRVTTSYGENQIYFVFDPVEADQAEGAISYETVLENRLSQEIDAVDENGISHEGSAEAEHEIRVNLEIDLDNEHTGAGTNSQGSTTIVSSGNQYLSAETQSQVTEVPGSNIDPGAYDVSHNGQASVSGRASQGDDSIQTSGTGKYSDLGQGYAGNVKTESSWSMSNGDNYKSFNAHLRTTGSIETTD